MKLEELGFSDQLEKASAELQLSNYELGRVVAEHKERYVVKTAKGDVDAEITGNLRFSANSREDFPAVGDWVALTVYESDFAIIHAILPRFSLLKRQAVGHFGEVQLIAANIDVAFLVQAVDRDFSVSRLERYLTICYASHVSPVIILTKTDLLEEMEISRMVDAIRQRIKDVPVLTISNQTQAGYEALRNSIEKGKTYCMLGSSGVGKSTLLNNLSGEERMKTGSINEQTNRGRHVTSHRELIILESGGILIDNPGMREVGIADTTTGVETTFDQIMLLSGNCKFKDCTHTSETGCAVLEALEKGEVDKNAFANYLKLEKEKAYFVSNIAERRRKEKSFGKILKDYYKKDYKQRNQ